MNEMHQDRKSGHFLTVSLLLAIYLITQTACSSWGTSYSGKYDENNVIQINLDRYGGFGFGHSGFGREILEGYMFVLKPIKQVYIDDEIEMSRRASDGLTMIQPVKGSFRFNADYTVVTIDIKTEVDGSLQDFHGNGIYKINEN